MSYPVERVLYSVVVADVVEGTAHPVAHGDYEEDDFEEVEDLHEDISDNEIFDFVEELFEFDDSEKPHDSEDSDNLESSKERWSFQIT